MRVYATAAERARATIREGHSAIVDAVFARLTDREDIERVAAEMSVPFVGIWLEAPESMLIARTEKRRNDPSDADADVIRMQHRQQNRDDDVAPRQSLQVTRDCSGVRNEIRSAASARCPQFAGCPREGLMIEIDGVAAIV